MADAAAARREARRRRILENSQNRLQLISGKSSTECAKDYSNKLPIPDLNIETAFASESSSSLSLPPTNNGVVVAESELLDFLSQPQSFVAAGDREITNDLAGPVSPQPEQNTTLLAKLVAYKYDIVILSVLIQLLYSFSLFPFDNDTYFFLPVIMYVVTKLIWFPAESKSNIANVLLLLNGMSANRVHKLLNVMEWVGVISQDICVYLFTTICIQSAIVMLKKNLVT